MSITLVTGVPGSGKTLYTIDKLLRPLIGATVDKTLDSGEVVKIPREIFTNINGLLLDHQMIEGGGVWDTVNASQLPGQNKTFDTEPVNLGGKTWFYKGNPEALRNWISWAKPGAVICFDEFQKFWPPRPNGAPIPPDLQTLDTHRHMGVDFILVTQNCMNVDRHILGLVDRHLHIRRVANMPMAVVYEWDHASKSLLYKNSITKSPWRYDKSVFKLYKSAELHTKQKRKIPGLVWFILAGLAGAAYAVPSLQSRLSERMSPKTEVAAASSGMDVTTTKSVTTGPLPALTEAMSPDGAASAPAVVPAVSGAFQGCVSVGARCSCVDTSGALVRVEPEKCVDVIGLDRPVADVSHLQDLPKKLVTGDPEHDGAVLAIMRSLEKKPVQ